MAFAILNRTKYATQIGSYYSLQFSRSTGPFSEVINFVFSLSDKEVVHFSVNPLNLLECYHLPISTLLHHKYACSSFCTYN